MIMPGSGSLLNGPQLRIMCHDHEDCDSDDDDDD